MFGSLAQGEPHAAALRRIEGWVRERFALDPAAAVLVTELACALPGCPPLETVVVFWTDAALADRDADPASGAPPQNRHHYKVFKPAIQVQPDDLPPYWMKNALIVADGFACDCC